MQPISISHTDSAMGVALTFGGMTFFSIVVAPLVSAKWPLKTAGAFIRQVLMPPIDRARDANRPAKRLRHTASSACTGPA